MDDLTSKVQEILGSEEGMKQIQEMAKALGLSGEAPPPEPSPKETASIGPGELLQIQKLMSGVKTDTPSTNLLKALRPLLKEERQHKVDDAIRILHLLGLLPLLQQSGALKGLLG